MTSEPIRSAAPAPAAQLAGNGVASLDARALLPSDPAVRALTLSNGLQCWLRPHQRPPEQVAMWLYIGGGSLHEEEGERGLAHFLEHLSFHGTEHFPPGAIRAFLADHGMRMGDHLNAFTSLEHTVFSLVLPTTAPASVDRALLCLADIAAQLSFLPAEVERERQVILAEMRERRDAKTRVQEQVMARVLPGSRVATRTPIGTEAVIEAADVDAFRAFYHRWYRPDRATLLVVGDVDAEAFADRVEAHFGAWRAVGPPPAEPDPQISLPAYRHADVITDGEISDAQVRLITLARRPPLLTVGDYRERLLHDIGCWIVNRRLGTVLRLDETPCEEIQVGVAPLVTGFAYAAAVARGRAEAIQPMLRYLVHEVERVRQHGFLSQELEEAQRALRNEARQAVRIDAMRDARALLHELVQAVPRHRVPMSKVETLALIEGLLPNIGLPELQSAFCAAFPRQGRLLLTILPTTAGDTVPSKEKLLGWLAEAENEATAPPQAHVRPTRLLDHPPRPGTVVSREEDEDLELLSTTFDNGVHFHARSMDIQSDRVWLTLMLGGGRIRETEASLGLTAASALIFGQPATTRFSSVQIRDWLTARTVVTSGWVADDAVFVKIVADPAELENGLELVHLLLREARIEAPSLTRWRRQIIQHEAERRVSVEAQLAERSLLLLSGDDPRFRLISPQRAAAITRTDAQAWLEDLLASAPIEAAMVGDLPRPRMEALARRFLGSLPARPASDPRLDALRHLMVVPGPLRATVRVPTTTERAAVLCGWRVAPFSAVRERRLLVMAEYILKERLQGEIREREGFTYSAHCNFNPSKAYPEGSLLSTAFYTDPARAEDAIARARGLVEGFAAEGPTEAEMDATRRHTHTLFEKMEKQPQYWCSLFVDLDFHGNSLEEIKAAREAYQRYTAADVRATLARYIVPARAMEIVALPA